MFKNAIVLIFLYLLPQMSFADSKAILVQGESIDLTSFKVYIKTHPEYQSFEDYLIKQAFLGPQNEILSIKIKLAQAHYLSGNLTEAAKIFQEITELSYKYHWTPAQKEVLFYAYIRMYQLTQNQDWLLQGLKFSPESKPSDKVFSPALLTSIENLKKQIHYTVVIPNEVILSWDTLIINGTQYKLAPGIEVVTASPYNKITLISNKYPIYETVVADSEIKTWSPVRPEYLLSGNCAQPLWETVVANATLVRGLLEQDCAVSYTPTHLEDLNLKPIVKAQPLIETFQAKKEVSSKKVWYWTAGVLVAGALLYKSFEKPKDTAPSHREGF